MAGMRARDALAVAAIALLAGVLALSPPFDILRGLSLDTLTALRWHVIGNPHEGAASPAVVVALDEDSYRAPPFEGTPVVAWTGEIGRVLAAIVDGGAAVVGFDVVFPTSIEESEIPFGTETIGARMRGFDRDFLRALAAASRNGKIVLGEIALGASSIVPAAGQRVAVGQQRNIRALNVSGDADGVVRTVPLMLKLGDGMAPAMALELAARALGAQPNVNADESVDLAGYRIPTQVPNAMTLNFDGGSDDIPTYSLADLRACLAKGDTEFFRRSFQGKVVLVGSNLEFADRKLTSKRFATAPPARPALRCALPAGGTPAVAGTLIDGVYVHATAVNNLLRHEAVVELAGGHKWGIVMAAAVLAAFAAFLLTPAATATLFLLAALAWSVGATAAFGKAVAVPLFEPLFAGLAAIVATTGFRVFIAEADKRFLRRAFALYLAPALVEKIAASSKPPALGGEMRSITVFFSDLAGFSSFAETLRPSDLVALMNRYLSAMTDIVEEHDGFVVSYIGDAIMAVFGAPIESPDHAVKAVRAAMRCCKELAELNRAAVAAHGLTLVQRIGLNSGRTVVGNIGSRRRFNYTASGDTVVLASRLEGANKYFDTSILASEATMAATGATFAWREIDTIRVKGRAQPVRVFEPLAEAGQQSTEQTALAEAYLQGLACWRARDFAGATRSFALAGTTDPASALFLERAKALSECPPGEDWEPINTLEGK
jgi:adenylate cyclase